MPFLHGSDMSAQILMEQIPSMLWLFPARRIESQLVDSNQKSQDIPELNKSPRLDRTLDVGNIPQAEINQLLILFLPQKANEALTRQLLPQSVRRQTVFCKAEIEQSGDKNRRRTQLFLLLGEVGAADEADGAFMTEGGEEL